MNPTAHTGYVVEVTRPDGSTFHLGIKMGGRPSTRDQARRARRSYMAAPLFGNVARIRKVTVTIELGEYSR